LGIGDESDEKVLEAAANGQAGTEKIAAMQTERFFAERRERADDTAFLRILNRDGGEAPRPEDSLD
jgi:hypothetical protein